MVDQADQLSLALDIPGAHVPDAHAIPRQRAEDAAHAVFCRQMAAAYPDARDRWLARAEWSERAAAGKRVVWHEGLRAAYDAP